MRQQRGRTIPGGPRRAATGRVPGGPRRGAAGRVFGGPRRRAAGRVIGRLRRRAARGRLGRIRLGTAGKSPRLRRWVLAAVLLGVALMPYPVLSATGVPPAAACRAGCHPGSVPSMVRWTAPLSGAWRVVPGLAGTVPEAGLAYAAVGGGLAVVGGGLTVTAYSSATGELAWQDTLTGFPAGAAIVSLRAWPGEVTAGVSYRPAGHDRHAARRTEVVLSAAGGAQTGRYPAAPYGGAVAGSEKYTVVVGATAVTSYDNATGHVRWQQGTGPVAQAWRTDGSRLYMAESARGFVDSGPVTALRRIDLGPESTGATLTVRPLEGPSFRGTLSTAFDGVVLFSSAARVTAYSGVTGAELWSAPGAVPEGADHGQHRMYLTEGSNLVGVNPQTGRVKATASGSAVNGAAGVYVVRNGVALGLDQGGNGGAWGFDLSVQRVTLSAAGLPWPHYFVDLGGINGSAGATGNLVVIAACTQLAPGPPAPSGSASAAGSSLSPSTPATPSTTPADSASSAPSGPGPGASSPAPAGTAAAGQGCLHPELVGLNL